MTVAAQLRAAYDASDLTVAEITAASGVSASTVLNLFRGRNVTLQNAIAVAQVLGLTSLSLEP